jgi:hypothetical protein
MLRTLLVALAVVAITSSAQAGTCSTGAYKTCVACCKTNPAIKTSVGNCVNQCKDYLRRR